jgi:hypothetical protein
MIRDKIFWIGFTMILGGVDRVFQVIPHKKGSKAYCTEPECTYVGSFILILGILIVTYKVWVFLSQKNQKQQ